MDFSRLRQGEIIAGVAGIALIIILFLPWYSLGTDFPKLPDIPGIDSSSLTPHDTSHNISGWDAFTDIDGFLIAAAGMAGIALAGLAAAGRRVHLGDLPRGSVTAALGVLATAVVVWRIFAQPVAGADLKVGIFLGLAAAIGVAVGALMALREGGFEPLVSTGGRSRARASSSSRAKPAAKKRAARKRPAAKK